MILICTGKSFGVQWEENINNGIFNFFEKLEVGPQMGYGEGEGEGGNFSLLFT